MGTGSTALAAVLTGREYLGAEINREYYEISQRRIEEVKLLEREGN
jgi:site-specific DNA-methyltransferase (adenine-specific)